MVKKQIILASGSPRRKELLSYIADEYAIIPSDLEETACGTPREQTLQLARDKAADVAKSHPGAVVIGADTLVAIGERVLGKPKDKEDAAAMLRLLSGKTHEVYTGVAIVCGGNVVTECVVTEVTFDEMTEEEISSYIDTGEPMDKAGAYGIQGYCGKFIRGISGDYFNVMGLPQNTVYSMLKKLGVQF
jgi:septum formation protein